MVYIVAQILGLFGFVFYGLSFWQKNRKKVLMFDMIECTLYATHYFLLGGLTGGIANIVGVGRSATFMFKGKNKFTSGPYLPIMFLFFYALNAAFTWSGPITLFPTIGSMVLCLAIWQHNTRLIRRYSLLSNLFWLIYAFSIGAYVAVATNIILMISTTSAIIKLDVLKERYSNYKIKANAYLNSLLKIFNSKNSFVYDKKVIKDPDYIKLVCMKGNKPLGYIALYPHSDFMQRKGFPSYENASEFSVYIWHMVVRKGYERKGVATALLNEVEKVYNGYEIYSVLDANNLPAVLFHNTNGFTKQMDFERVYYGNLEKFDLMQLKKTIKEKQPIKAEVLDVKNTPKTTTSQIAGLI